jgi:hypothetical protein
MSFASAALGSAIEQRAQKSLEDTYGTESASAKSTLTMPSGALWLRKWRILVTDAQDNEALNVSDLHCTFEVHKKRNNGGFYAVCRIYNLNTETEDKLVMEGDRLIIEAGYIAQTSEESTAEDGSTVTTYQDLQYGKIFDGKIVWPSRSRDSNVDYVLTLMAIDGDQPLNLNFISKTVNRGLNSRKILETVAKDSEEATPVNSISDGLSSQALPRGKVFFGKPYKYVQDVCRGNAASFYIEDGSLNVTRLQDVKKDEAIVVTPETGLIGTPQQVQFGVSFKLLLNPAIHLESLIQIKNVQVNEATTTPGQQVQPLDDDWVYQVCELTHIGDTRGNDWYTEIQGISRYGKGSLPALLANSGQNGMGV